MLTGGDSDEDSDSKRKTWFFDLKTEEWTEGPQTQYRRSYHACGKFTDANGHDVVVVAGFFSSQTELLYMDQPTGWVKGNMETCDQGDLLYFLFCIFCRT